MMRYLLLLASLLFSAPAFWVQKSIGTNPVAPFTLSRLDTTIDGQIHDTADTLRKYTRDRIHDTSLVLRQRLADSSTALRLALTDPAEVRVIVHDTSLSIRAAIPTGGPWLPLAAGSGSPLTGDLYGTRAVLTTTADAPISIVHNLAGGFTRPFQAFNSGMVAGNQYNFDFGQSASTNNAANFGFKYVGAGLSTNYVTLGMYGANDLLTAAADGTTRFSGGRWSTSLGGPMLHASGVAIPSSANFALAWAADGSGAQLNGTSSALLSVGGVPIVTASSTGAIINGALQVSGLSTGFVRANASGQLSSATLVASDIPALDAAKITTGTFADARIASATTWSAKLGTVTADAASRTANTFYAAPNGAAGAATFRAIVAADIPTLNQNTTGSAAKWTTPRTLTIGATGKALDGSANVSWSLAEIGAAAASSLASYLPLSGGTMNTGAQIATIKDVTPSTSANTNYALAPIVAQRSSNSGTTTVAAVGFHNFGVNAAALYYDAATSVFRYNRHTGDIVTIWDASNLTNLNQLTNGPGYITSTGSISGNAATATKWTTPRTLTIGATGKTIDGTGNQSWSLAEIGAQAAGSYLPVNNPAFAGVLAGPQLSLNGAGSATIGNGPYVATQTAGGIAGWLLQLGASNTWDIYGLSAGNWVKQGYYSLGGNINLNGAVTAASAKIGSSTGFVRSAAGVYSASPLIASDIPALGYQPLENQRLSTTNSPTFFDIVGTGTISTAYAGGASGSVVGGNAGMGSWYYTPNSAWFGRSGENAATGSGSGLVFAYGNAYLLAPAGGIATLGPNTTLAGATTLSGLAGSTTRMATINAAGQVGAASWVAGTDYLAPSSIAIPSGRIAYGTGSGLTSATTLTTNGTRITAGVANVGTWASDATVARWGLALTDDASGSGILQFPNGQITIRAPGQSIYLNAGSEAMLDANGLTVYQLAGAGTRELQVSLGGRLTPVSFAYIAGSSTTILAQGSPTQQYIITQNPTIILPAPFAGGHFVFCNQSLNNGNSATLVSPGGASVIWYSGEGSQTQHVVQFGDGQSGVRHIYSNGTFWFLDGTDLD